MRGFDVVVARNVSAPKEEQVNGFEQCQKAIASRQTAEGIVVALRGGPSIRCQLERIDSDPFEVRSGSRALPSCPEDLLMNTVPPGFIDDTIFTDGELDDNWATRIMKRRTHKPDADTYLVSGASYIVRRTYRGSPDTIEEWWISGIWVSESCKPEALLGAIKDAMAHPQSYPNNRIRTPKAAK